AALVEHARDAEPPQGPLPALPGGRVLTQPERVVDAMGHEWRRNLGRLRRVAGTLPRALRSVVADPIGAGSDLADATASIGRLLRPATTPLSPIMRERSLSVRFDTMTVPVARLKAAARRVRGKLNDAFVAGVAGGLRRYHEVHGAVVPALRM